MKSCLNKEQMYSLNNSENYKKELDIEIIHIIEKVSELFLEYFKFIKENIKIKKSNLSKFIIIRGLDTIVTIFNYILFYSKNIDMTYFHCQKAYYFYIEFVGQISDDEKTFLQLNSRDATLYVYKKTIFELYGEIKKNNEDINDYTRVKIDIINIIIDSYKTILLKLINNDFMNMDKIDIIENIYKKFNSLTNKSNVKQLNNIIEKLYYDIEDIDYFLDVCLFISKKIIKNNNIIENCSLKISNEELKNKINEPVEKFCIWFTS
jgi:hypothetical protein